MRIKNILKKAIVLTLASVLTVSAVPVGWTAGGEAQAADSEEKVYGDFKYVIREDGTVEILEYTGESEDVIIPESIEGKLVTKIRNSAFWYKVNIVSIELPKGIESYGPYVSINGLNGVFGNLSKLETISVDENSEVYYSENGILFDKENQALLCYPQGKTEQTYSVPEEIKAVESSAFWNCESLIHVELPSGLTQIKSSAFEGCKNLMDIQIPDSVTLIGSYAFSECENLESIVIPENTDIETSIFYGCTSLKNISVDSNNKNLISNDGVLLEKGNTGTSLYFYPPAKEEATYAIPEGVTTIAGGAFRHCENLLHLQIPESLANIEEFLLRSDESESAFWACDNIESFSVDENNDVFYSEDGVLYQYLADGEKMVYRYPQGKNDKVYVLPEGITRIGASAFEKCRYLESILLNDGLKRINAGAFYGCSSLTDIVIPESVEYINSGYFLGAYTPGAGCVFAQCTSLKSVVLPSSLTIIGSEMFSGCSSLTSIDIPDTVETICYDAFENCTALKNIHLPQSLTLIHYYAFNGCSSLEDIQLPEGLQEIGWEAFKNCESLSSIRIPDSVIKIGDQALGYTNTGKIEGFRIFGGEETETQRYAEENGFLFNDQEEETPDDSEISNPTEPDTDNQQKGNQSITQQVQNTPVQNAVTVGTTLTDSGKKATYTVTSVTSKGGTVTYVKPISSVSKLTIPSTVTVEGKTYQVTAISANAFKGQKKLKTLTIPASVTKIGNYAFKNCKNLKNLIIKSNKLTKKSLGKRAFKGLTKKTAVQVPKKKLKAYKKLLKQCGLSTSVKVKGK